MKLIILHGPPASGKLTLANRLKDELGYNVLHNHLTVDLALEIYREFGERDFYYFVNKLRNMAIEKACQNQMEGLILTFCFNSETDMPAVERWESIVKSNGGKLIPVYLCVEDQELSKRVVGNSRVGSKKIQCQNMLQRIIEENHFGAIPHPNTVSVETSNLNVEESVNLILSNLF